MQEVTRAALDARRHVWSEKPLALSAAEARALVEAAEERGLRLGCAPMSFWGEAQQALAAFLPKLGRVHFAEAAVATALQVHQGVRASDQPGRAEPSRDGFVASRVATLSAVVAGVEEGEGAGVGVRKALMQDFLTYPGPMRRKLLPSIVMKGLKESGGKVFPGREGTANWRRRMRAMPHFLSR